jgi:hypothetical protein
MVTVATTAIARSGASVVSTRSRSALTAYATVAKLSTDSAATCAISKNASGSSGTATANGNPVAGAGYGDTGFNVGIAHTF